MVSPVIDISHHNPEPDWERILAAGVVGVILKATEGTTYIDNTFASRRERARAAGLLVSSYHFLRPGNMTQQMQHYLDVVSPVPGERVVIDHEDAGVSLSALKQAVQYLLDQPLNLQVTLYSGHLIKEQLGSANDPVLNRTSLWIAQYTSASSPSWPKGTWPSWSLWQWTDSESIPGISAPVDGDRWNGSVENLKKWLAPAGSEPTPAPEPEPEREVLVALTVPEGVTVKVSVNGEMVL